MGDSVNLGQAAEIIFKERFLENEVQIQIQILEKEVQIQIPIRIFEPVAFVIFQSSSSSSPPGSPSSSSAAAPNASTSWEQNLTVQPSAGEQQSRGPTAGKDHDLTVNNKS